jgi:hypothetical protein
MTDDTPLPFDLSAVQRKKLTIDFDSGNQAFDAGLHLLGQVEKKLGVCKRLADAMPDRRYPSRGRHKMVELVMERAPPPSSTVTKRATTSTVFGMTRC